MATKSHNATKFPKPKVLYEGRWRLWMIILFIDSQGYDDLFLYCAVLVLTIHEQKWDKYNFVLELESINCISIYLNGKPDLFERRNEYLNLWTTVQLKLLFCTILGKKWDAIWMLNIPVSILQYLILTICWFMLVMPPILFTSWMEIHMVTSDWSKSKAHNSIWNLQHISLICILHWPISWWQYFFNKLCSHCVYQLQIVTN